jgi:hypothetical protein
LELAKIASRKERSPFWLPLPHSSLIQKTALPNPFSLFIGISWWWRVFDKKMSERMRITQYYLDEGRSISEDNINERCGECLGCV